jgi:bifunctional non-homologous end joining protein LigD
MSLCVTEPGAISVTKEGQHTANGAPSVQAIYEQPTPHNERKDQMNTTISPPQAERITLYYREGSSDKVYQATIEPKGELFIVTFAFGRRGSTLSIGTKTSSPVDYETAKNTFDKLVREKTAKGYTPGENGTPYQHSEKADQVTGILPQLLNPIEYTEVKRLLKDPAWCVQEKFDGKRTLLQKNGETVTAINRKGLAIGLPSPIAVSAQKITRDFVIDGECVGDVLYAFDLLELTGEDYRSKPYQRRLVALARLIDAPGVAHIELAETTTDSDNKERQFTHLRAEKREGVVLKRLDAPYAPGRPASGGPTLKHKFYATLSAVVAKVNPQRSVELRLLGQDGWQSAGNVTIPPNHPVPKLGQVVEVRYLYAFSESGSIYQPTYLGVRSDTGVEECTRSQLKFKATEAEEE